MVFKVILYIHIIEDDDHVTVACDLWSWKALNRETLFMGAWPTNVKSNTYVFIQNLVAF